MNPDGTGVGGKKLRIYFKATAQRLTFDKKGKATGVIALIDGVQTTIKANKEVIVGGNLQSAHILQASGIGNATLLNSLGIKVIYNNPNVGKNLANHPSCIVPFRYNETAYGGFFAPGDEESMFAGGGFYPAVKADGTFEEVDESKPREFQTIWMPSTGGRVNFYAMLARPQSLGQYLVQSTDPLLFPLLDENTFTVADDLEQFARYLFHFVQNTLAPKLASKDPSFVPDWPHWNTIDDTKAWIRNNVGKATHYVGTNKMSRTSATGVVDYAGRVHGVPRLRVIDTSIIPTIPDGNTGAVGFMLGWVIGDSIVAQYS
jgi:choline dehydrogenase